MPQVRMFDEVTVLKEHEALTWYSNEVLMEKYLVDPGTKKGVVSFYWNDGSFLVDYGFYYHVYYRWLDPKVLDVRKAQPKEV